jgi:beta-glucanase (GH16 family)
MLCLFIAIWFLPEANKYGNWPASGEIDLVESRGNRNLIQNGVNIGAEQMGATLHFGPKWPYNGFATSHFTRNLGNVLYLGFHKYQMVWTPGNV